METLDILQQAKEIHEQMKVLGPAQARSTLIRTHRSFYEQYPKVFEGCLNPYFDFKLLEFMLSRKDTISENNQNINEIDKEVIGHLKEVYVNPLLERMNIPTDQPEDLEMEKKFEDLLNAQLPAHLRPKK